tara:strand:+ start:5941 stop:7770 length:1830 start_codon:yes stop_codon:yes gene_type:complete
MQVKLKKKIFDNFFLKNIKKVKLHIFFILLFSFISTILLTVKPLILAVIVNKTLSIFDTNFVDESEESESKNIFNLNSIENFIGSYLTKLEHYDLKDYFIFLIILLIIFSFLGGIFKLIANFLNSYTRSIVITNVRSELSKKIINLSMSFFNKSKTGDLLSRVMNDSQAYAQGIVSITHRIFETSILIIIYSIYLISTNLYLTLWIVVILIINYTLNTFLKKPIKRLESKIYETTSFLNNNLQEIFSNIRIIKIFGNDNKENTKLHKNIIHSSIALFKSQSLGYVEPETRTFLSNVAEAMLILVSIIFLINGNITVQGFILYLYIARLLMFPVNDLATQFIWIQRIRASFESIKKILNEKSDLTDGDKEISDFNNSLNIKNIYFSFKNQQILKNININIKKGEIVGFVGKSGAGKSTLADLILRLYDPEKGEVLIDGVNIKNYKSLDYKSLFGVVTQDTFLFNDTIENNIKFGRNVKFEEIVRCCKIANADEFISNFEYGYKTVVGDRGLKLSGGQKQRIAIARCLINNPKIIIFDEATSSLDTGTEYELQKSINNISKEYTIIIIAHRLATIKECNKIYVFNNKNIESFGNHNYLIDNSPTYKYLHTK